MRKKLFTFLALAASVGMMNATPTFIVIGTMESIVLADSPAPAGDMDINPGIPTTDQW